MMKPYKIRITPIFMAVLLIIIMVFSAACTKAPVPSNPSPQGTKASQTKEAGQNSISVKPSNRNTIPDANAQNAGAKVKANENGQVMVLMYHGIGSKEAEWVRTPENFRKDLETLYKKGYRLISLKDYVENRITVKAGYTPFVLTFDDGLLNQFNILEENGQKKMDPSCAVGILESFFKNHPDFGRGGSFYVYYPIPFRQKELIGEKYEFLIKNGYEIGNHSYNHDNLGHIPLTEVQKSLALNVKNTKSYIPDFEVFSLALPYGAAPKGDNYKYVVAGKYNDTAYNHKAVLLVGSNPAFAPNHMKFNPLKLPRVRGSEMKTDNIGLYDWLSYFDRHPEKKYISDGNTDTITIPEREEKNINKESIKGKQLIIYKEKQ